MREILTILAALLVTALTVALVGPFFIDWNAHRDLIEAQMTRALGTPVTTRGAVSLRLLPSPLLIVDDVATKDRSGGLAVHVDRLRLELAVAPLLRGELQFLDATLTRPEIRIRADADGALALARPEGGDTNVQVQALRIVAGRLVVERQDTPLILEDVALEAELDSLIGPFRGSGSFRRGAAAVPFRFSVAARDGDRMRAKIVLDAAADLPKFDLDGALTLADSGTGQAVAFAGAATISGAGALPWRAAGSLKLDAQEASLEPLDLRIGRDDGAVSLSGSAKARFTAMPQGELTLNARQIDLDRLGQRRDGASLDAIKVLREGLADPTLTQRIPVPLHLRFQTPALIVNGDTLSDVDLDSLLRPDALLSLRLAAAGPGRTSLKLDGVLETGAAARFQGRTEAEIGDTQRAAEWLGDSAPDLRALLRAIPFRGIGLAGTVTLSAAGFSGQGLALTLDRSRLAGAATFTRSIGAERGRVYADLTSDALDLDGLPDLSGPGAALTDLDLALSLDARAVRVARFGDGMIDAGRIRARLTNTAAGLKLDDLSVVNLGGASLRMNGETQAGHARLEGHLAAQRLNDLADVVRRVAPGPWSDALSTRAVALSPAQVSVSLEGSRTPAQDAFALNALTLEGTARGTTIAGTLKPDASGGLAVAFSLDSKDASALVRQLGFEALAIGNPGPGHLAVTAREEAGALSLTGDAALAGMQMGFRGRASGTPQAPRASGDLTFRAIDGAPFLRMMTLVLPDLTATLPVEGSAQIDLASGALALKGLRGSLAGATLAGDLDAAPDAASGGRMKLGGTLQASRASLPAFASLLLGPSQTPRPGARWSDVRFAPAASGLPLAQIDLRVGTLDLSDGMSASDAAFTLGLAPGVLSFEGFRGKLGAAPLDGRLVLRRDGPVVSLSGTASLAGLTLERPGFAGTFSGHLELTATGQSMQALAGGLAGEGSVTAVNIAIPRADPDAPGRVLAQSDAGSIFVSENDFVGALRRELDKAPFRVPASSFEATLAAGTLRLKPNGGVAFSYDVRSGDTEARATLGLKSLPKDWEGPAPQLDVVWKGPPTAPARTIEAGSFVNALAARAIGREALRVEALEGDIRERAFFVRRQKALDFLHRRQREIAAFEAEQVRLAAEDAKRRADEDARARALEAAQTLRARQTPAPAEPQAPPKPLPPGWLPPTIAPNPFAPRP